MVTQSESGLLELARWVSALRYEDIPPSALRAARIQIANMTAAAFGSAHLESVQSIHSALAAQSADASGTCTALATGQRFTLANAVIANAAASMAQDFDDIIWTGHTCHSAVFAP